MKSFFRSWAVSGFVLAAAALFNPQSGFANILGNSSFEIPIGNSTINWDETNGTVRTTTVPGAFSAFPDGTAAIVMDATTDFTFQTVKEGVQPGDLVVFSAQAESSVGGGSGGQLVIEFQRIDPTTGLVFLIKDVQSAVINTTNAPNGGGYVTFTISGEAPRETAQVTFTLRRQGAGAGTVVFDNANGEFNPVRLTLTASKTSVQPGDIVTFAADFRNESVQTQTSSEVRVELPAGLDFIEGTVRNNGRTTTTRQGSVLIASNTLSANDDIRVVFQVLITPGVSLGKSYEVQASIVAGARVSEVRSVVLHVRGDPTFDEGTILGKVFDDRDEDGTQTKGETGVPRVRLYTEYGVSVVTDSDGRFHIPAVRPGRHVLKVDGHTLPPGTRFVTEESLLIKTTPGLLNKVKFAVHLADSALPDSFKKELQIWVTQGVDLTPPQLDAVMDSEILKVGLGRLEKEPVFKVRNNYGEYISDWKVEIIDELGEKVWTGIGIAQPPVSIPWNGMTDSGEMILPGVYAYRLIVRDKEDREDWTPLKFFRVLHKSQGMNALDEQMKLPETGAFSVFRDGKRTIPLAARPVIRVYGKTQPDRSVQIGGRPVTLGSTGEFEEEFFVKPGDKKIQVTADSPEGERVVVEEPVTVKDSVFFMVGLGEQEFGGNVFKGNQETLGRDEEYHEGFYQDGRLSYYLKAKIKGKFLVKSRYDTGDKRSELFTNLDPDAYYPVYGDYSQLDFEGQETRERLYLLVEMDRSFLKWGSYHSDFTDTELSRHNRTLSGLKVHHESLSTTRYGDAARGFTMFYSKPRHLADHNEFRGTGGSLYYLRNRNLLPGSEKLRIEVRDKIQDIPISSKDLIAGKDYEIDYKQGRILLREPLSSVSSAETIISNDILDGNAVYLIVDYEYETFRTFENSTGGLRGFTHIGDHIRVGGTAVEENRQNIDYDLRGADAVIRMGKNTKVVTEIAQSRFQQVTQGTSFNGGLSFQDQSPIGIRRPRETAYLIKGETKPIQPMDLSGYIQDVAPGFSVDRIKSQEGFRKYGLQARLKLTNSFYVLARHDSTELSAQIRPLTQSQRVSAFEKLRSSTVQAVLDHSRWNVVAEYLNQHIDVPLNNRTDSLFSQTPFGNAFGLKVGKRITDQLTPYARAQYAFSGKNNFQAGGGIEAKLGERTRAYYEQMFGRIGDSSLLGISRQTDDRTTSYASIKVRDVHFGDRVVSTSIGSSHQLTERSRVYSEREYSTYSGNLPLSLSPTFVGDTAVPGLWSSDIYGYETQFRERWQAGLRFERRHLNADDFRSLADEAAADLARTNTFNTLAMMAGYNDPKKVRWDSSMEFRLEPDAPEIRQWLTQNSLEFRINQDLSFLGRTNFGTSRFLEPGALAGRFLELNTGFAYRPVENDRFNALTKYTMVSEQASDAQFTQGNSGNIAVDEKAHIFSIEGAYELTKYLQMTDKFAYRLGSFKTALTDWTDVSSTLWIQRFNYHITRKWDLGLEYRMLFQGETAESLRHGPLVEVDRELYDYVRLGIGYNFTDFDDDLRPLNDFRKNGFFVRLSGKV